MTGKARHDRVRASAASPEGAPGAERRGNALWQRVGRSGIGRLAIGAWNRVNGALANASFEAVDPKWLSEMNAHLDETRRRMDESPTPAGDLVRALTRLYEARHGQIDPSNRGISATADDTVVDRYWREAISGQANGSLGGNPIMLPGGFDPARPNNSTVFDMALERSTTYDTQTGAGQDSLRVVLSGREGSDVGRRRTYRDTIEFRVLEDNTWTAEAVREFQNRDGDYGAPRPVSVDSAQIGDLVTMVDGLVDQPWVVAQGQTQPPAATR